MSPPPTRGWTRQGRRCGVARCLPRPRGDGPPSTSRSVSASASPPPTRGWTRRATGVRDADTVSPAHAGMDLPLRFPPPLRPRLPRPRGDGPVAPRVGPRCRPRSPPPTRGWTLRPAFVVAVDPVSPAHAGMDPCAASGALPTSSLPRPRGDGPGTARHACAGMGPCKSPPPTRGWTLADQRAVQQRGASPPPTRGWTPVADIAAFLVPVSPAHAGMDPGLWFAASQSLSLPRPRGDGPHPTPETSCRLRLPRPRGDGPPETTPIRSPRRSPPPTRGWTLGGREATVREIVSPAHAGMDPRVAKSSHSSHSLPRPRGDGPANFSAALQSVTSPPPTRGWTRIRRRMHTALTVSPAHAGMDPMLGSGHPRHIRLPRPRGDGPVSSVTTMSREPSPPPTRGWTVDARRRVMRPRGLPRPRGDGPARVLTGGRVPKSPPPTRGWTHATPRRAEGGGVSPAHAGMDPRSATARTRTTRLPRPRGDGPRHAYHSRRACQGSPPPTRGWTPGRGANWYTCVSPAHAGMDPLGSTSRRGRSCLPRPRGDGP